VLGGLPSGFPAAVGVVQHLPVGFTDAFVEYLRSRIVLTVKKVVGREVIRPGVVYLPADDRHLVRTQGNCFITSAAPAADGHRPSVDVLLTSLALTCGSHAAGVILSGIGQDGVRGLLAMRERGATTIAQSEESCAVFGMPQAALNSGAAGLILSPEAIVVELRRFAAVQGVLRLAR
jgi:two-component system chemotaxis response regulator CheB